MSSPLNLIAQGSFVSDGISETIPLRASPTYFTVFNQTKFGSAAASTEIIKGEWWDGMSDAQILAHNKTSGAATVQIPAMLTTNGITVVDTSVSTLGPSLALTVISAATPAVVTLASTAGLTNGDTVKVLDPTGMLQIGGIDFTIGSIVANTSLELSYLPATGFAAPASAGSIRRVSQDAQYAPRVRTITSISQAAQAVITFSETHGYGVGEIVRFHVSSDFGMIEMEGLSGVVRSVDTAANTVTVSINSTAFTAFAYPTSVIAAGGISYPHAAPFGDEGNVFSGATVNQSAIEMQLGSSSVGATSDVIQWRAFAGIDL